MPNSYGQQHPWERSGMTYGAWYRLLRKVTEAHVKADWDLDGLFPGQDKPTIEATDEFLKAFERLSADARQRHQDWWDTINSDGQRIRGLAEKYGVDPTDEPVGD